MDARLSNGRRESDDRVAGELLRFIAERLPVYEWLAKKPLQ
jgi:hypothetical protein